MRKNIVAILVFMAAASMADFAHADGWAPKTKASNTGSIKNTRHNMTVPFNLSMYQYIDNVGSSIYNGYGEVCVYCHTPHGANSTIDAPLWNRTNLDVQSNYVVYNTPLTSGQSPTYPGINSLTCLSCHDGVMAIDAVVNMPGSGKYSKAAETQTTAIGGMPNDPFLSTWDPPKTNNHYALSTCVMSCHATQPLMDPSFHFEAFLIGWDLTNDHPVGVQLPDPNVYDFKAPNGTDGTLKFFDVNTNGKAEKNEVRFYDTGDGFEVECASCHDPHGVPSAGAGSKFIPSFLRVSNAGSALCLTCHDK